MRHDHDSLGSVELPDDVYYGVHTERARHNFAVSGTVIGDFPRFLTALAEVKKAAALANADIGVIRPQIAAAICQAADEVIAGRFTRDQFPVDALSGGGGVSPNMNLNEVLANRANEILCGEKSYGLVHPNNHVNTGQSTTDVIATAVNLALRRDIEALIAGVGVLETVVSDKIAEYRDTVKLARTCLQDAVPITVAQEFGAYRAVVQRAVRQLRSAAEACLDVPMGATVVGTGLGVGAGYTERIYPRLAEVTGLPVRRHPNFFDIIQNGDIFQHVSTTFKALATSLAKMSRDLCLLSSGTRAGLMEITLPAVQAGSSFMPGKVNPVLPKMMTQIAYQVCGNDMVITMAVQGAELDFNTWTAVIAKNLFESGRLLQRGIPLFATRCVQGLRVNTERCRHTAENSLALSAVLATVYGYEAGAHAARHAEEHGTSIRQAAVELGITTDAIADELLDPLTLTDARLSATVLDRIVDQRRTTTRQIIATLPVAVRTSLLAVATAMAHADGTLTREEASVLHVIADTLQLPADTAAAAVPTLPDGLSALDSKSRELIYTCAFWLALADQEDTAETRLLAELRTHLGLDDTTCGTLHDRVRTMLRNRSRYVPRCEELPWWEDFANLVTQSLTLTAPAK